MTVHNLLGKARSIVKLFIVLLFSAGALHFFRQAPPAVAASGALARWVLRTPKYFILAVLGLEMLFGGGANGGGFVA